MAEEKNIEVEDLAEPLTLAVEPYLSRDYAQAEADRLWPKVWQHAGRVEELRQVGDFFTYDIMDDSILVVRTDPDTIKAYHNVCSHRGRQLVEVPEGAHSQRGHRDRFVCGYHGWRYGLDGKCQYTLNRADWKCALTEERTRLPEVRVDTWGGFIWINMDPDCVPLREFLQPAASMLDPFELHRMRYRWRQWVIFDCNWKVALEAFMEPYHVEGTHPQLTKYGDFYAWSRAQGLHGNDGFDPKEDKDASLAETTVSRAGKLGDARQMIAQMQREFWDTIQSATTPTLVQAAERLVDELPEGTPASEVHHHWLASARKDDAARGVEWPTIDPHKMAQAGLAWHVFPNATILQGLTFALCYRTRPHGSDPGKCIFEAFALERFPEGEEPKTEWVYAEATEVDKWRLVLTQDFSNMRSVQKGMRSRGFRGPLPNPYQERKITNFHRNLAHYIGTGAPRRI